MRYGGILRSALSCWSRQAQVHGVVDRITFSVFLMMMMTAMFAGILNHSYSTVTNIGADMWIMDPSVNTDHRHSDARLCAGRGAQHGRGQLRGALFIGGATLKLKSGTYVSVSVIGLDDFTLFGRPTLNRAASSTSTTIIRFWSFTTLNSRSLKTQDRHLIRA